MPVSLNENVKICQALECIFYDPFEYDVKYNNQFNQSLRICWFVRLVKDFCISASKNVMR